MLIAKKGPLCLPNTGGIIDHAYRNRKHVLTSERSKFPFVHRIIERTDRTVLRMAYCRAPTFIQNNMRLKNSNSDVEIIAKYY